MTSGPAHADEAQYAQLLADLQAMPEGPTKEACSEILHEIEASFQIEREAMAAGMSPDEFDAMFAKVARKVLRDNGLDDWPA